MRFKIPRLWSVLRSAELQGNPYDFKKFGCAGVLNSAEKSTFAVLTFVVNPRLTPTISRNSGSAVFSKMPILRSLKNPTFYCVQLSAEARVTHANLLV